MFGLDDAIASVSDGTSLVLVVLVAILLGLRHATDPDHVAAVGTLVASRRGDEILRAARLGLAWGLGHAVTLFVFGVPFVVFGGLLPDAVQRAAETAVGILIVVLALRLLQRWRRGALRLAAHPESHGARTPLVAFGIGLLHGVGGSAGVTVLVVASVGSSPLALLSLGLLGAFTALSMTVLTTGLGRALSTRPLRSAYGALAPALGAASLAFGLWYAGAAWHAVPYPL